MRAHPIGVIVFTAGVILVLFFGLPLLGSVVPSQTKQELSQTTQPISITLTEPEPQEELPPPTEPLPPEPIYIVAAVEDDYFDDALFIGDSLTYGLQAYNIIPQASFVASIGVNISSIATDELIDMPDGRSLSMLQAIAAQSNPTKVYIMMGTNGINWLSVAGMIETYGHLVTYIRECFPEIIVYIQSILPTAYYIPDRQPGFNLTKMREYNQALKDLAIEKDAFFVDMYSFFADSYGYLPGEIAANDGIHIGSSSYQKWYEYLKEYAVVKVMPE